MLRLRYHAHDLTLYLPKNFCLSVSKAYYNMKTLKAKNSDLLSEIWFHRNKTSFILFEQKMKPKDMECRGGRADFEFTPKKVQTMHIEDGLTKNTS